MKNTHFISVHRSKHFTMSKRVPHSDLRNTASIFSIQGILRRSVSPCIIVVYVRNNTILSYMSISLPFRLLHLHPQLHLVTLSLLLIMLQTQSVQSNSLLMTCRVLMNSCDGAPVCCRALLGFASLASFVTKRLSQSLNLPRSPWSTIIMSIVGLSHTPASQALTQLIISPTDNPTKEYSVTAMTLPHITCDLPLHSVSFSPRWMHLSDVTLADPDLGIQRRLISYLASTFLPKSCVMAGSMVHLAHHQHSRLNSVGS